MQVREYSPADAGGLAQLGAPATVTEGLWRGQAWVVVQEEQPVGLARVTVVPGLEGVVELDCFVAAAARRRGAATALLKYIAPLLSAQGVRQLSHPVHTLESGAARFLLQQGFYLEHEEWEMRRDELQRLPAPSLPPDYNLHHWARAEAISRFRQLYDEIFGETPWYQPYRSDSEVGAELERAGDLLFLLKEDKAVGIVWTRLLEADLGEIEPIGILAEYRGQGLGRELLLAGISALADRGATYVQLGVWRSNEPALRLYQGGGFKKTGELFYLAYDLK